MEGLGAGGQVWQQAAIHAAVHVSGEVGAPVLLSGGERRHGGPEQQGQAGAQGLGLRVSPSLCQGAGVQCRAGGPIGGAVAPESMGGREHRDPSEAAGKLVEGWSSLAGYISA